MDPLERCTWPRLDEPYGTALREAVRYIFERWEPVAIVASGTIIRGTPAPTSDLDLYVLHDRAERQRVQRFFHGVPTEFFVNPPFRLRWHFERDRRAGVPMAAHLLTTGVVVYEMGDVVAPLQAQAQAELDRPPSLAPLSLTGMRYLVACDLEDASDVAESDPEACAALLGTVVTGAVRYRFWEAGQWQPRAKDALRALDDLDAELARNVRAFYRTADPTVRLALAQRIVARSVHATGFFEWESEVEAVSP